MSIKIFLSHSAADEPIASALVDCLLSSMMLEDGELRCTSVQGHKLPVGSDFAATLLEDIDDSSVVIGLITKNALSSSWVLFELGATWGSKKNLKPLVTDEVDLKMLPGPLSGRHVARLSNRGDVAQFLEELTKVTGAKARSRAKIDTSIGRLLAAHAQHIAAQSPPLSKKKIETKPKEPTFGGVPFSELVKLLSNETVKVPAELVGSKTDTQISLFDLFIGNAQALSEGLQSNWERGTHGGYLYQELGLRLLSYGLAHFEKVPAVQARWFKRIGISPEGHKFLLQYKRLTSASK